MVAEYEQGILKLHHNGETIPLEPSHLRQLDPKKATEIIVKLVSDKRKYKDYWSTITSHAN